MIHTLAAMHAATRARKQQSAGAKTVTVEVRKRRRPSLPKEPRPQSGQASEKADD